MRKLILTLLGCAALGAFMGLSVPAWALTDRDCDGSPYPSDPLIHEFAIDTPDSHAAHDVSGTVGGWLACGTDIGIYPNGVGSQYVFAEVLMPPDTGFTPLKSHVPDLTGSFVGKGRANILTWRAAEPGRTPFRFYDIPFMVTVDNTLSTDCPADAIACYKGELDAGLFEAHAWSWVTKVPRNRYKLNVGELHSASLAETGLTRVQFDFCDRVGQVGGTVYPDDCGGPGRRSWATTVTSRLPTAKAARDRTASTR